MKLRLKGFTGIKSGPNMLLDGPDEITIDFTGKEGIVAICGENGCGKSTVTECLTHYPRFLSRGTKLWANCYARDAEKEFESDFMGHHYRSLVKIDAQTHKMEGFLFVDGSPTSCCPTSISAFEDKVTETFGKWETFKRAQFSPQRSRETSGDQIENMSPGDFRDILREYLNLQLWDTRSKTAKAYAEILTVRAATLDTRIDALNAVLAKEDDLSTQLRACERDLFDCNTIMEGSREKISEKRATLETLRATIQANALALQRKADLQGQIDRLTAELAKEKAVAEGEIAKLTARWKELKAELTKVDGVLAGREAIEKAAGEVHALEVRAADLQGKMDKINEELPGHQQKVHDLETQIAGLRQQVKDLDADAELREIGKKTEEAKTAITAKRKEIKDFDTDPKLFFAEAEVRELENAAKVGDGIDAECKSTTCAAIRSGNEAKEKLPVALSNLTKRRMEIKAERAIKETELMGLEIDILHNLTIDAEERTASIAAKKQFINDQVLDLTHDLGNAQQVLISTNEILTHRRKELATKRAEIAALSSLSARAPEIAIAEARKQDLEKQRAEAEKEGTAKKNAWYCWELARINSIAREEYSLKEIVIDAQADIKLIALNSEIMHIETVKLPAIETEIQTARDKIAQTQAELARIADAEKELATFRAEKETLAAEAARWRYLQNFCGEKGYQAVAVSAATPRIIKYANDLLTTAFDVPYTVRLKTQDDQGKEIFKVVILCPDGREVDLDAISGGQRSWAIPPLLLGMSLLSREESGREFDYFCVDEIDGAMSDENKVKCANFYPAFMKLAKLKYLPFITHCESARNVADHRLIFEAGKGPVWG